jgi:hypothetical protein
MTPRLVGHLRCVKDPLVAAVLLVGTAPSLAQLHDTRNAAGWYSKAIHRLEAAELSETDWRALREYQPDSGAVPTESMRAALARLQPVFRAIRRGSRQDFSDFDLDYSEGFGLLLPHLGSLRSICGLMTKDVMVQVHDGDAAGAAETIAALYRMSDHLADDRVMVSSLVGQSVFEQADRAAQAGLDRSAFGAAESSTLLEAVKALDDRDPFDVVGALRNEQQSVVGWVREQYGEAEDRAWMLDELGLDAKAANVLAGMMLVDEARFESALQETDEVMGRVVELFTLDDAAEAQFELARLAEEIGRGEHGPLAAMLVPNVSGVYKKMIAAQQAVADRTAVLQDIVDGNVAAESLANAAVWYLQAVQMLKALDPQTMTTLREIAQDPTRSIDDTSAGAFRKTETILATMRTGSQKPRCDFTIARHGRVPAIPPYLPGLRDAARLLHADAVRSLQRKKPAVAADRLATCFRLSRHLAGDLQIPSTLTSHVIFNATTQLAREGLGSLTADQRAGLLKVVLAASPRDPFGYVSSQAAVRTALINGLPLRTEARRRAQRTVGLLDGDRLLYLTVVAGRVEIPLPETEALDDVISLEALAMALTEAARVREEVAVTGDLGPIARRTVPDIGQVGERFTRARSDLRRAIATLEPTG